MAYGFNGDRSKVEVYSKAQIDQMDLVNSQTLTQEVADIESNIAPVEGINASTDYAVGDYFVHEDTLYLVTSAITAGDAITPNTNCTATTIMAELVRLTS